MKRNNKCMEAAMEASTTAGEILMRFWDEKISVSSKESMRDVVTEVDKLAENVIVGILKKRDKTATIVTEEQGKVCGESSDKYWLIDALDGTVNYVHGVPFFCVSVAYIEEEEVQASAVYAPLFNDLYYASRNAGSFKNDKLLKIKDVPYSESLFSVSFSGKNYDGKKRNSEFNVFAKINDSSRGCLRTGSAALNLAYLAGGHFNGCWGKANKYWDIAAGLLIAEMAGAKIRIKMLDKKNRLSSYLAVNSKIFNRVAGELKDVLWK